jgi:hypothetical protein
MDLSSLRDPRIESSIPTTFTFDDCWSSHSPICKSVLSTLLAKYSERKVYNAWNVYSTCQFVARIEYL